MLRSKCPWPSRGSCWQASKELLRKWLKLLQLLERFEDPFLRKLSTAVSCVGSSPPVIVVAFAATLFVLLARCQPPLF